MRGLLFDNLAWKFLSLGLSVLLWYGMVGEIDVASSMNVPVLYKNLPRNVEISSDLPERIHLKLRGASARLTVGNIGHVAAVLDLSQVTASGERTFVLDRTTIDLPYGIELIRAVPSQVKLTFEKSVVNEVPVRTRFASPPPSGYTVIAQHISPPVVRIAGPESRVRQTAFVETDPIDLATTYQNIEVRTTVGVDDPHVQLESSPQVTVRIAVEKIGSR